MTQRTVRDLISELQKIQAEHGGDLPVKAHLQSLEDANGGDYTHDDFDFHIETINQLGDDCETLKENWKVLSIFGGEYTPEDYKTKEN